MKFTRKKDKRAFMAVRRYARPYRFLLARGLFAAFFVAVFRLAIPWPLRWVVEIVFPMGGKGRWAPADFLPSVGEPILWLGLVYVLVAVGLGLSEMFHRVSMMQYATHTTHDLRAAAVRGAAQRAGRRKVDVGDLIVRVIGDTARIKAGLSGILVHSSQNGLLFIFVSAVMLSMSLTMGFFFLVAGLAALGIGFGAVRSVTKSAGRARRNESDYAKAIEDGLDQGGLADSLDELNEAGAHKEVRTTKLIARSTVWVHFVLAVTVSLALWFGARDVARGAMQPGEIFLFIAYALIVHRRMVQVGRQMARGGKVLACAVRINSLIEESEHAPRVVHTFVPLEESLQLRRIKVRPDARKKYRRTLLKDIDLTLPAGSKTAVLGAPGAGKSVLLRVLAGMETPKKGDVLWDGANLDADGDALRTRSAYLPQSIALPPQKIWRLLGFADGASGIPEAHEKLLDVLGITRMLKRHRKGLKAKVAGSTLSRNEARLLSLAKILMNDNSPLWLFDSPLIGCRPEAGNQALKAIFKAAAGRTLVMSVSESLKLKNFDQIILLRRGKIAFRGDYQAWLGRKEEKASLSTPKAG